jgi:hypothetical protein
MGPKALSAKVIFRERMPLDHRAHGTIQHKDSLSQ